MFAYFKWYGSNVMTVNENIDFDRYTVVMVYIPPLPSGQALIFSCKFVDMLCYSV